MDSLSQPSASPTNDNSAQPIEPMPAQRVSTFDLVARFVLFGLLMGARGYRRFEWKCNALNAPSRRSALRFGFSYEGLFRRAVIIKGRSRDTTWYAMIGEDWPRLKRAYETWLDAANFDAGGRQRQSLSALTKAALAS